MNSPADNGSDREKQLRLAKRDFIREMAVEAELQSNDAERAYNAFITTVLARVRDGYRVNLTGFGTFERRMREGHVSRFSKKGTVEDYAVLAFKATRASSEFITLGDDKVEGAKVPGIR